MLQRRRVGTNNVEEYLREDKREILLKQHLSRMKDTTPKIDKDIRSRS